MATTVPRSVIIKPHGMKHSYWSYTKNFKDVPDAVILDSTEGRYNLDARIEVEPSKVHSGYVHLRFFNANKYCTFLISGYAFIVAKSDHPEEDLDEVLGTLFEVVKADDDGYVYLNHVYTKFRVQYYDGFIGLGIAEDITDDSDKMLMVDWEPQKTAPSSVAATFPRFIMLKPYSIKNGCWAHVDELKGFPHSVILETDQGLHNPHAKIEIQPAESDTRYVHLRFCNANKYCCWSNSEGKFVLADSDHPEEVLSDPSCTLFEPVKADEDGYMYLIHVYSKLRAQYHSRSGRIVLGEEDKSGGLDKMLFVDWESVLKLPEHVAFKDDNGKYLQVIEQGDHHYVQFSSDDPYEKASGFRVYNRPDGYVRIKSDLLGKFWRRSPNWIWVDAEDDGDGIGSFDDLEDAFWPIKIDENTIALQSGANKNFCKGLSVDWKKDCLNAAVSTATKETRMQLVELLEERKVFRVIYRMDEAQIFDPAPFVAGKTTVINREGKPASMEVEIAYEDEISYTFNRSVSLSVGVTTKIEAQLPGIFSASVEKSIQISGTLEWGTTTTEKTSAKAKGIVNVPANSMAVVHYVGTKATCNIPYSYVQQDKSSTDGKFTYTTLNDGVYTGVNCFDFDFIVDKALKLDLEPTKAEMLIGGTYNHKSIPLK